MKSYTYIVTINEVVYIHMCNNMTLGIVIHVHDKHSLLLKIFV